MKKYRKTGWIYASLYRPILHDELVENGTISVSKEDRDEINSSFPGGMVATNPDNLNDCWYINRKYFKKNYEEV